jgi:hypothetical protein
VDVIVKVILMTSASDGDGVGQTSANFGHLDRILLIWRQKGPLHKEFCQDPGPGSLQHF